MKELNYPTTKSQRPALLGQGGANGGQDKAVYLLSPVAFKDTTRVKRRLDHYLRNVSFWYPSIYQS